MSTTQLEWRRRWKPDLSAQIWQPFQFGQQQALVKCLFRDDRSELLVYDMVTLWYEECSRTGFEQKSKKLNPNVEAPMTTLLQHLRDNLTKQGKKSTYRMDHPKTASQGHVILRLSSQLTGGVPFKWEFHLRDATNDMYALHLATPLLTMVSELSRRQAELHKILKRKDAEIEDYKAAGGKISRKHLETTPFEEKVFLNDMNFSTAFDSQVQSEGSSAFSAPGQGLYRQIMMTRAWLNRPEEQDSDDELSDDVSGDAGQTVGQTSGQTSGPSLASSRLPPSLVANAQTAGATYGSPTKSITPKGSPVKGVSSPGSSSEDTELIRRQALERRLADAKDKQNQQQQQQTKKKKKKIF